MALSPEGGAHPGSDDPPKAAGLTGLLIIRAWVEAGSPEPLRAQIRLTSNVSTGIERTLTLAHIEDVTAVVREWLQNIVG